MFKTENLHIDLHKHLALVKRKKYLILAFCLSASLSSLVFTYVFPEEFEANVTIQFRPNEATKFQPKAQEALGFPVPVVSLESIGNTLEDVAKSEVVVRQVVRSLQLDVNEKKPPASVLISFIRDSKDSVKQRFSQLWQLLKYGRTIQEDSFIKAVAGLQQKLSVKPTKKGYTFRLSVSDHDPQRAAAIVDTEAEMIVSFLKDDNIRVARQGKEGVETRLHQNEREVVASRRNLDLYKKKEGISSYSEELSLLLKTVVNFEEELARVESDLKAAEKRRDELKIQLDRHKIYVIYTTTTTDNPIVQEVKSELTRLDLQRSGLLEKFMPEHQEVRAVEAKIAEAQAKLKQAEAKIVSSESLKLNDIYQKIMSDIVSAEADIRSLAAKAQKLQEAVSRAKSEVVKINDNESRLAELTLQLEVAERSFKLLSDAYEEAKIAESKAVSEIAILNQAVIPSAPVRPIKVLHVSATIFLSLLFAIGAVFVFNYFDPTLRHLDQVERLLNVPILATIPQLRQNEIRPNVQ